MGNFPIEHGYVLVSFFEGGFSTHREDYRLGVSAH